MKSPTKQTIVVRSILDLGDYNDDEVNTEPSLTDPSQDEPIEALVARMLRGEIVGTSVPQFDTTSDTPPAEVYAAQSAVSKDGFDLADAPAIAARAEAAAASLKVAAVTSTPDAVKPASGASEAVPAA